MSPWRRAAHLQQTVATAALSQGFGGGRDHVLLLLSHSQRELVQHTRQTGQFKLLSGPDVCDPLSFTFP